MADTAELERYIHDTADICCFSLREHPEHHDAIMEKFLEIEAFARQAFGWTLTVPVGYPEGLSPEESSRLQALMEQYEFSDDVWTEAPLQSP